METATMDKVLVTAKLENLEDLYKANQGSLPADQIRSVEVLDALVDTGATGLFLPKRLVTQLGLQALRTRWLKPNGENARERASPAQATPGYPP